MKPEGPVVTLAVWAAGQPEALRTTLQSIGTQTCRPAEILVPAGALSELEELGDPPPDDLVVRPLAATAEGDRSAFLSTALDSAGGEFVGFVDAGVWLHPEHLALLGTCLQGSERVGCYSDAERCDQPRTGTGCEPLASPDFDPLQLLLHNGIPLSTVLFRRQTLLEIGGVDPQAGMDPGWDLLLRIAGEGQRLYHLRRITVRLPARGGAPRSRPAARAVVLARHGRLLTPEVLDRVEELYRDLSDLRQEVERISEELVTERRYKRLLADALDVQKAAQGRLGHRCQELEASRRALEERYETVAGQLDAILASRAWRLVQGYGAVRARLRLPASGRRVLKRGVQILDKEGVQGIRRRVTQSMTLSRIDRGRYPFQPVEPREVALDLPESRLETSISVVIPTRNAGPEFRRTLRRIRTQVAVLEPEIVVIDSGSTDGTVEAAQAEGARVLQIPPESFHHAETRNQAARHARGEILVFTVQDASPAAPDWLHRLVAPLVHGEADVVSARQIPRADADLYALIATWGFDRYLGFESDTLRKGVSLQDRALGEQRRLAHLDNVCLAIPRTLQAEYPFDGRFAEDLHLGRRLLEAGYGLLHQVDNAVVHSHTRAARYFFLRAYVDLRSLFAIFGEEQPRAVATLDEAFPTLAWIYNIFAQELWDWLDDEARRESSPARALGALQARLEEGFDHGEAKSGSAAWDPSLFLAFMGEAPERRDEGVYARLRQQVLAQLQPVAQYLSLRPEWGCPMEEVAATLHKVFAAAAGCALAEAGVELPARLLRGI